MLKTLYYIRNKKELQELYLSQMPEKCIRSEINSIINETRKDISPGMRLNAKNIAIDNTITQGTLIYQLSPTATIQKEVWRERGHYWLNSP